jgi:hypothetical protein
MENNDITPQFIVELSDCCGINKVEFLTLDHIYNDGAEERKLLNPNMRGGVGLYRYLRDKGFPNKDRYQVLCYNCNCAKDKHGICPHKNIASDGCQL